MPRNSHASTKPERKHYVFPAVVESVRYIYMDHGGRFLRWSFFLPAVPSMKLTATSGYNPMKDRRMAQFLNGLGIDFLANDFRFSEEALEGMQCEIEFYETNTIYWRVTSILRPLATAINQTEFEFPYTEMISHDQILAELESRYHTVFL